MAKVDNKTKGFNSISREVVYDFELSDRARFLYVYMACKPDGWEFYQDKVAEELGYKKDTLRKYMDELIKRGWIEEKQQQNNGKFGALEYIIRIERKKGENLPIREKPDTEKTRYGKNPNQRDIDNISSDTNVSSDKEEIYNRESISKTRFQKPKIEDVEAYIKEKGMHFDANDFYDHYEAVGWMVGRNHMKDWKASCRTWENKRKSKSQEEEKTKEEPMPAGMTREDWEKCEKWLRQCTPRICGYITPSVYMSMKQLANDGRTMAKIILYIERSSYTGDILSEFKSLLESGEYKDDV